MKKLTLALLVFALAALLVPSSTLAAEGKTITLKGKGLCAKCCLKEGDACQNVVQVKRKGKTVSYYLADNDVSKDFHKNICKKVRPIEVKGVCKKQGDKLVVTAESIQLAAKKKKKQE